jgi:hypothetical protein
LDARGLIEHAKGTLVERERLDEKAAFIDLRRAARSSRRELPDQTGEPVAGLPLPRGPAEPAAAAEHRVPQLDVEMLDADVAAFLEQDPGADGGIGPKLSLLLLGSLTTPPCQPLVRRLPCWNR